MDYKTAYHMLSHAASFATAFIDRQDFATARRVLVQAQLETELSMILQPGEAAGPDDGEPPLPQR